MDPVAIQAFRDCVAGKSPWPLLIHGSPGNGKTCAGLVFCDRVIYSEWWIWTIFHRKLHRIVTGGQDEEYIPGPRIEGTLSARMPGTWVRWTVEKWWRYIKRLPLVVVDDVALSAKAEKVEYEAMHALLENRVGLPLVLTSNLALDGKDGLPGLADVFDERVRDRIRAGTQTELTGDSRRW